MFALEESSSRPCWHSSPPASGRIRRKGDTPALCLLVLLLAAALSPLVLDESGRGLPKTPAGRSLAARTGARTIDQGAPETAGIELERVEQSSIGVPAAAAPEESPLSVAAEFPSRAALPPPVFLGRLHPPRAPPLALRAAA